MKQNNILKATMTAAASVCTAAEGMPSCATCAHAHPVPDGEPWSERNVYCRAVDYSEKPNGLKVRRTSHCSLYCPNAVTINADVIPLLREAFGGWGIEIRVAAHGTRGAKQ